MVDRSGRLRVRTRSWALLVALLVAMLASEAGAARRPRVRARHAAPRSSRSQPRPEPLRLSARAVRVQPIDPAEGKLPPAWLVRGETRARPIASVSKLTALMVVLDHGLDFEGTTRIEPSDHKWTKRGARSRLRVGTTYRNRDLVTAALMSSDNRAVIALGRAVGLSRRSLTIKMVAKARSLGLHRSRFGDPTGLSYDNVASPEAVLLTLRAALGYEAIRRVLSTPQAYITPAGATKPRELYVNTNRLVRWGVEGVIGGKTGYNGEAGNCLTFAIRVDGVRLGVVLLGAPTREGLFADAQRLVRWVREESKRRAKAAAPVAAP